MVLSNHSMVFEYVYSLRSFFASRPYNYDLCRALGRRTWKAYLECLYCKVKHGSLEENNIQTWSRVQVCGYEWKVDSSKMLSPNLDDWDHGLSLMLILSFLLDTFFLSLSSLFSSSFPTLSFFNSLFSQHIAHVSFSDLYGQWREILNTWSLYFMERWKRHVCREVERNVCASSQCKSIA